MSERPDGVADGGVLATRHRLPRGPGFHELPAGALEHLRFGLARLAEGQTLTLDTEDRELLLVVLDAPQPLLLTAAGSELTLPARRSVFADGPSALYAPADVRLRLSGPLLAGIFQARAPHSSGEPYVILPDEVQTSRRGHGSFARDVCEILPPERPAARLLAGETINPPGNWSSSPPHKHDCDDPPTEARLEEVYLYRMHPAQGFALQHSYHAGGPARTFAVGDLDVAAIPAGYHPVVAAPGYELYYLWCLAGEGRTLRWRSDPAHAWVDPPH